MTKRNYHFNTNDYKLLKGYLPLSVADVAILLDSLVQSCYCEEEWTDELEEKDYNYMKAQLIARVEKLVS